jgi:hypothetical protein
MRNVILFVVVAAAALVADASPSTGHAHIAALLRRQLPGSSTSSSTGSSSFPGIDPSSITANAKCQSPCSPFTDTSAVEVSFLFYGGGHRLPLYLVTLTCYLLSAFFRPAPRRYRACVGSRTIIASRAVSNAFRRVLSRAS